VAKKTDTKKPEAKKKELAVKKKSSDIIDPQDLTLKDVKQYFCEGATEKEVQLFLQIAKTCNLNPFLKQIYLAKYGTAPAVILTSYNVYLQRAEKSGNYAGLETTTEGSVENGDLKGIVKVYRKDWTNPLIHEADYSEYVQRKRDGSINKFWKTKPKTMIKKVAISQAFRLAFPCDFEGMPYTNEEINTIDVTPEKEPAPEAAPAKAQSYSAPPESEEQEPIDVEGKVEEEKKSEFMSQEEFTNLIKVAVKNKWMPPEIEKQFSTLGYKILSKMKMSLKLSDLSEPVNTWDYESIRDTVSKPRVNT